MSTLSKQLEALTTIHNYEHDQKKQRAQKEASKVVKLWDDGHGNAVAALISKAHDSGDIMHVSYLMEEVRRIMKQNEKGETEMKYRAVLRNVNSGAVKVESIWVDDIDEARRIGEDGLKFYGGSEYTIEEIEEDLIKRSGN